MRQQEENDKHSKEMCCKVHRELCNFCFLFSLFGDAQETGFRFAPLRLMHRVYLDNFTN